MTGGGGGSEVARSHRKPERQGGVPPQRLWGNGPAHTPIWGCWPPEPTVSQPLPVLSHPVCGQQPQETEALVNFILITFTI